MVLEPHDRLRVEQLAQPPVVLLARDLEVVRLVELRALELDLPQVPTAQPVVAADALEQPALLAQVDAGEHLHPVGELDQADRPAEAVPAVVALAVLVLDLELVLREPRGQAAVAQRAHQLVTPAAAVTGVQQRCRGLERGRVVERRVAERVGDVLPEHRLGLAVGEPPGARDDRQHDCDRRARGIGRAAVVRARQERDGRAEHEPGDRGGLAQERAEPLAAARVRVAGAHQNATAGTARSAGESSWNSSRGVNFAPATSEFGNSWMRVL